MDNDTETTPALPAEPAANGVKATPAAKPARGRGGWILIILALLLAGGWAAWQLSQRERASEASRDVQLMQRLDEASRHNEQIQRDVDTLRTRLGDMESINRSLREEVLGLGERSRNMEDAVANLAEERLSGRDALALGEAEYLLQLAGERLGLFHDVNAAINAYRYADSALAAAEDPLFASVRQTIAAEIQALLASEPLQTQTALASLARLRSAAIDLPQKVQKSAENEPAEGTRSRFATVFAQFVRITRDNSPVVSSRDVGLARTLIQLDLRAAEAALLARDPQAFTAALGQARTQMEATFDDASPALHSALSSLDQLAATPLAPTLPELGSALKELRNLRATHVLSMPPASPVLPQAAPTQDESDIAPAESTTAETSDSADASNTGIDP